MILLLLLLSLREYVSSVRATENLLVPDVSHTFYGYPDNDPPGSAIAYDCGRGLTAAGTGTYDDPLTFASVPEEFDLCEIIYDPYLHKYLRHEDYCVQCDWDWDGSEAYHIDVWTGSNEISGGDDQIGCEIRLTPQDGGPLGIMRNPTEDLPVDEAPLYTVIENGPCGMTALCNVDHVYPDGDIDDWL